MSTYALADFVTEHEKIRKLYEQSLVGSRIKNLYVHASTVSRLFCLQGLTKVQGSTKQNGDTLYKNKISISSDATYNFLRVSRGVWV